jgi:hypothetical protein
MREYIMTDKRLFKSERDVRDYFIEAVAMTNKSMRYRILTNGIFIDTKLRKEILTGVDHGRIVINGRVEVYIFKNLGGGVYNCNITGEYFIKIINSHIL